MATVNSIADPKTKKPFFQPKAGDRFGKLVFVEMAPPKQHPGGLKGRCGVFRCDCGTEKVIMLGSLRQGFTASCGCGRRNYPLAGERFGNLVFLRPAKSANGVMGWFRCNCGTEGVFRVCNVRKDKEPTRSCGCMRSIGGIPIGTRWAKLELIEHLGHQEPYGAMGRFLCDCGGTLDTAVRAVKIGAIRSCGCLRRESLKKLRKEGSAFRSLLAGYRSGAADRGLEFTLSEDEFRGLTSGNCAYCGIGPSKIKWNNGKTEGYPFNGIDRIDNAVGYVRSNCASCCFQCNRMKGALAASVFVDNVKRIYKQMFQKRPSVAATSGGLPLLDLG